MSLPRDIRDGMTLRLMCIFVFPSEYDVEAIGLRAARELAQEVGRQVVPDSQALWVRA